MAIDDRDGLSLPRTGTRVPSGVTAGGGIGGATMNTSRAGDSAPGTVGGGGTSQVNSRGENIPDGGRGYDSGMAATTDRGGAMAGGGESGGMAGTSGRGGTASVATGAIDQGGLSSDTLRADANNFGADATYDDGMSENRLIAADRVTGTAVYDKGRERIGTIDNLMIDKVTGEVAYAVMSFGGFLGIGERYHPLPWDVLTYDTELGGYNIGMAGDQLRDAPNYDRTEMSGLNDRDYGGKVDDYYAGRSATPGMIRMPGD